MAGINRDNDELKDVYPSRVITLTDTSTTATLNAEDQDVEVVATAMTGATTGTIYLPPVDLARGKVYTFWLNGAPGGGDITIVPYHGATYPETASGTIVSLVLDADNDRFAVYSSGRDWFYFGGEGSAHGT